MTPGGSRHAVRNKTPAVHVSSLQGKKSICEMQSGMAHALAPARQGVLEMKTMALVLCAALCLASTALAADVTGTWTGTLLPDGANGNGDTALMTIRQEGDKVIGSAGPNQSQQYPLTGSVKDDRLTFEIKANDGRSLTFDLQITGDQMTGRGEMRRDGQPVGTAVLTLKREPAKTQN